MVTENDIMKAFKKHGDMFKTKDVTALGMFARVILRSLQEGTKEEE